MITHKGYKYRIYPGKAQAELLSRIFGCCRFVHNHFLSERRDAWTLRKENLSYVRTAGMLTALKRDPDHLWLAD